MVRIGTLPLRMLALRYGADIVYSPEIIDRRLAKSRRVENVLTGTIDFIDTDDGSLNLRVHPDEKHRLVVQIGSADPENAVKAAKIVENDVGGIDLNCGCPKRFSTISKMGSELLSDPDRLCSILRALVESIPLPITAKIRILPTIEQTIDLVKRIEACGVSALAVHCRQKHQRPQDPGDWSVFQPIAAALTHIPLIANGDIFTPAVAHQLRAMGVSSIMIARAAQTNFSVFSESLESVSADAIATADDVVLKSTRLLDVREACRKYLLEALKYDMAYHNAKYTVVQMWAAAKVGQEKTAVAAVKSFRELCEFFGLANDYDTIIRGRVSLAEKLGRLDLISEEIQGVLGPECPYIPDAPYLPPNAKRRKAAQQRGNVSYQAIGPEELLHWLIIERRDDSGSPAERDNISSDIPPSVT